MRRYALSPRKKRLKKDWLFSQQSAADYVPDLFEAWAFHNPETAERIRDDPDTIYNLYSDEIRAEAEADVEEYEDVEPGDEDYDDTLQDYIDDIDLDPYIERLIGRRFKESYDRAVDIIYDMAGDTCYRAIRLDENVAPENLDALGIFWSHDADTAKPYDGEYGRRVLYAARIDRGNIDMKGTVLAQTDPRFGDYENEVRFHKHAPIFVYYAYDYATRETIATDDWRRA